MLDRRLGLKMYYIICFISQYINTTSSWRVHSIESIDSFTGFQIRLRRKTYIIKLARQVDWHMFGSSLVHRQMRLFGSTPQLANGLSLWLREF